MAEYIEREAAIKEIIEKGLMEKYFCGQCTTREIIESIPAADVRENVKGEWKPLDPGFYGDEVWECSACGETWYLEAGTPKENNMNFCPRCGAQMGGAVDG